jgi:hypothetical protein
MAASGISPDCIPSADRQLAAHAKHKPVKILMHVHTTMHAMALQVIQFQCNQWQHVTSGRKQLMQMQSAVRTAPYQQMN